MDELVNLLIEASIHLRGFPGGAVVKTPPANIGDVRDTGLIPGLGRSPGEGNSSPLLPGESHGLESLTGRSPGCRKQSHTAEQMSTTHLPET